MRVVIEVRGDGDGDGEVEPLSLHGRSNSGEPWCVLNVDSRIVDGVSDLLVMYPFALSGFEPVLCDGEGERRLDEEDFLCLL